MRQLFNPYKAEGVFVQDKQEEQSRAEVGTSGIQFKGIMIAKSVLSRCLCVVDKC